MPLHLRVCCLMGILLSWALLAPPPTFAQPMGPTVVVPFGAESGAPFAEATKLEGALGDARVPVISLHEAHDRFLARSFPPASVAPADIDLLVREAQAAIDHVAFGRAAAAERSVQRIVGLAERGLETMNRDTRAARKILDACLALVRASLHEHQRDEALEQAMRCRRLVPDLAPSDVAHPANVVGALAEADDQLRRMRTGELRVRAQPEQHCEVYLNGRHLGHTPFTLERAPAGEYRVQIECDSESPGRVHRVVLGDDPVQLVVRPGFDRRVGTEPRLWLHYKSEEQEQTSMVLDALQVASSVSAEDVVLLGLVGSQLTVLRVRAGSGTLVAGVRESALTDAVSWKAVVEKLANGRYSGVDPSNYKAQPEVVEAGANRTSRAGATRNESPRTAEQHPDDPKGEGALHASTRRPAQIMGWVLLGTGLATLGASFGLYAHSRSLRHAAEQGVPGSPEQQRDQTRYEDFRLLPLLGVAGSALAIGAVPLLLPKRPPHTAGWVGGALAGALGLAAMAIGAVQARDEPVLGGVLVSCGAPLVTIPITQLVRASRASDEKM